eukprot:m.140788 g.140788  ORF g.140788 m.140788 type:complete len:86 (+) comp15968_c0_seq27:45-302(+)
MNCLFLIFAVALSLLLSSVFPPLILVYAALPCLQVSTLVQPSGSILSWFRVTAAQKVLNSSCIDLSSHLSFHVSTVSETAPDVLE